MKSYIDHLTVAEYEFIEQQLRKQVKEEEEKMKASGNTKNYIELRFILIKIRKIIEKYKKN